MNDADALLLKADVAGARTALIADVRSRPSDDQARMFLFQLLALNGEWDKAQKQLQAWNQIVPDGQMLAATYSQAIQAELDREAVFQGQKPIRLLAGGDGWAVAIADAIGHFARGEVELGEGCRDAAFDAAPDTPGVCDGQRFDWIADSDSRFGPTLEVICAGQYGLIPFDAIKSVSSSGPVDLRDVIWFPVEIEMRNGPTVAAFLPARYPGIEASLSGNILLGRVTSWAETPSGPLGTGQKMFSFSEGEDRGLLELRRIEFD